MTLEQFAKKAGVVLVACDKREWGGHIGYTEKSSRRYVVAGFKTKRAAYEHWLEATFGEGPGQAVIALLNTRAPT